MKLRSLFMLACLTVLLTACNFTLAADVTPPPGYVAPTPMPTLGPLYPAQPMDIYNGANIYMEKCAACHGATGLGDGEKGKQLPVKVAPIGLADFANKAQPAAWYAQVTQGNIERFMPPFVSLTEQERWDVVGYALFLSMDTGQIDQGKELLATSCADCAKYFSDIKTMSALSGSDLVAIIKNGKDEIPAFGKDLTDEELAAVAIYLRSLTFSTPAHGAAALPEATATPAAVTPPVEATPGAGTQIAPTPNGTESAAPATQTAGIGNARGTVDNQTGAALPADAKVVLRGYEHGGDPSAGPTEVVTIESSINADGSYLFENIEIPEKRIFIADIEVNGLTYRSEFVMVEPGMVEVELAPIVVYATTDDLSVLKIVSLQLFFDFATEGDIQIFAVYSIMNDSNKTVMVNAGAEQKIPFIAFPTGAVEQGYEVSQDSAPFTQIENGLALPPSATPYGLIAFSSMPKTDEIFISQPALMPIDEVLLFLPEGMNAEGKTLIDGGIKPIQTMNFHAYTSGKVEKGASIEFTLTGAPAVATAVNPDVTQNKNLLIGVGAFGLVLILLGAWLFIRDRNKTEEVEDDEEDAEDEFDDADALMDAIIALDELHRSGKISDAAYKQRRAELKNQLKRK